MAKTSIRFPEEGLNFLKALKRNNKREWFQKRKDQYERCVRGPMTDIVLAMKDEFRAWAPEMVAEPGVSLYRIYRDTRFSSDKTPYKTHTAASFPARRLCKHMSAGLYFHISGEEVLIAGGVYAPGTAELALIRHHIADRHKQLKKILTARGFSRMFGGLEGDKLTRVPRGFPPDHPAAEYLKYRQLLAWVEYEPDLAISPMFFATLVKHFEQLMPLVRFINEPLMRAAKRGEFEESLSRRV